MSITQKIIPQAIMPVYNENIYAVSSSNISKERFNYVFDVYDHNLQMISRIKMPPRPDGYAIFDVHRIMENYVSYDFAPSATGYTQNPHSFTSYKIQFGESYTYYWTMYDDIWSNGNVAFYSNYQRHYFNVGDKVLVTITNPVSLTANPTYNGVHTVTAVPSPYQIVTDLPWNVDTPAGTNGGTVVLFNYEATVLSGLSVSTSYMHCINGVKKFNEFNDWNYQDWNIRAVSAPTKKLLTTIPTSGVKVRRTDKMWLSFMSDQTYGTSVGYIETYNSAGALLGRYKTSNVYGAKVKTEDRFAKIACGPSQLNYFNSSNSSLISGSFPILTSTVASYSFQFGVYNLPQTARASQKYTFTIDDCPALWSTVRLVFLDRMGSFVGYNFRGGSRKETTMKKTSYRANYGTYQIPTQAEAAIYGALPSPDAQFIGIKTSTKGDWYYNDEDRGLTTIDTSLDEMVTVFSSWETQEIGDWLAELATSPAVYQQNEDGTFSSVSIEDMTFEIQQRENGNLIGYELKFRYANKNNVQRG